MNGSFDRYESTFRESSTASDYEQSYTAGTSDEAAWRTEQSLLADIIARYGVAGQNRSYLDFACGTGRIISYLETEFGISRGIDTSSAMLRIAASKVRRSELICANILSWEAPRPEYDVITAFRFFLNAELKLRPLVMQRLSRMLRDEHSLLIFNNHGNPFSYKAILWPYHQLRRMGKRRPVIGNYMTDAEVQAVARDAGLRIIERHGYGFVSNKLFSWAPKLAHRLDAAGRRYERLSRTGVNQLYVTRRI